MFLYYLVFFNNFEVSVIVNSLVSILGFDFIEVVCEF